MKLQRQSPKSHHYRSRGISLIECLVYIGAMAVVMGMGMAAYRRSIDHTLSLRRNTDDITQALAAGEYWRADIRAAVQTPNYDAGDQTLRITTTNGTVAYRFADQQMFRRANDGADWTVILPRVQQSEMLRDVHTHVTAWRWELELKSQRAEAALRPLFTFTAVNR